MAVDKEVGSSDLRSQFFDKTVKGIAIRSYKFMQAVTEVDTTAWKNFFWRESATPLTATGQSIRGIPRGAQFPQASPVLDRISSVIEKYGLEQMIPWEDIISDDLDVQERALFKLTEGVIKAVDDQIYTVLSDTDTSSNINVVFTGAVTGMPAGSGGAWNETSSAFIDDLLKGKQLIGENSYDTSDLMLFLNPRDYRSALRYLTDKGAQFPRMGDDIATNGRQEKVAGIQLVTSISVPVSRALLVKPKRCGTWKSLVPLQTTTIEDKYRNVTVRVVQEGVCQLTDPLSVVLYKGTQKGA